MSYHIKIKDSVPLQYRNHVESWLNNAIDFLLSIPRPQNEQLIPSWDDIRFTICDHFNAPHGLFSRIKWNGYAILPLRDNGDLLLMTEPKLTVFMDQDVETATMCSWIHLLDQMFVRYKDPAAHLSRQLLYLEQYSPALHKEATQKIKADGAKRRNAARRGRRSQTSSRSTQNPKSTDSQSLIHPPMNPRQAPVQKPITAPQPLTIDEMTQRAIDQQRALWDSVHQGMKQDSTSCES